MPPIEEIRVKVQQNEQAMHLVHMSYNLYRLQGPSQTLFQHGTWIQKDSRHYLDVFTVKNPETKAHTLFMSSHQQNVWKIDSPTKQIQVLPGSMPYMRSPAHLGLYLRDYKLSQLLCPEWAKIQASPQFIDRRPTWVVDIRPTHIPETYFPHRVWIDQQRGVPVQVHTYAIRDRGENNLPSISETITSIKYAQLDNGAWIPVQGVFNGNQLLIVDLDSVSFGGEAVKSGVFEAALPADLAPGQFRFLFPRQQRSHTGPTPGIGPIDPLSIASNARSPIQTELLSMLRDLARQNEEALSGIEFQWSVSINTLFQPHFAFSLPTEVAQDGGPVSSIMGRYARCNQQHLCEINRFSRDGERFRGSLRLFDSKVLMQATYVVDARCPSHADDYVRLWLDCYTGFPLHIEYYGCLRSQRMLERLKTIEKIQWYPITDTAWLPISGVSTEYRHSPQPYEHISTIDIHLESLREISVLPLTMPFRIGAIVYDVFNDKFIQISSKMQTNRFMHKPRPEPHGLIRSKPKTSRKAVVSKPLANKDSPAVKPSTILESNTTAPAQADSTDAPPDRIETNQDESVIHQPSDANSVLISTLALMALGLLGLFVHRCSTRRRA